MHENLAISEIIKREGRWELKREAATDFINFISLLIKLGISSADITDHWNCMVVNGRLRVISVVRTK